MNFCILLIFFYFNNLGKKKIKEKINYGLDIFIVLLIYIK